MSILSRIVARLVRALDYRRQDEYIKAGTLQAILRHEDTRGVDLPTWRTPKEIAQMRRQEQRAALRAVRRVA